MADANDVAYAGPVTLEAIHSLIRRWGRSEAARLLWRDYAIHQEWCRPCAEGDCYTGKEMKAAAEKADEEAGKE